MRLIRNEIEILNNRSAKQYRHLPIKVVGKDFTFIEFEFLFKKI